jgi:hypothetical protein
MPIARLTTGFVFLLAKPKFYSHLASWRVVIRTPDVEQYLHPSMIKIKALG